MLSTRFSVLPALRAAALAAAAGGALRLCRRPAGPAPATTASRSTPASRCRWRSSCPTARAIPGREQIARSLENAARLAQARPAQRHDRPRGLSRRRHHRRRLGRGLARRSPRARRSSSGRSSAPRPPARSRWRRRRGLNVLSFTNNASVAGAERLHPRHHLREHRRPAGRLRPVARASELRRRLSRGARGRDRPRRGRRPRSAAAARRSSPPQPYNLSVEGIQAAAGPIAAALTGAGANAVILTDGPTGGLAFISEALRGNGLGAAQAQFLGMQRWDVSAEALAVPSLQGGVFAAPDPALVDAFTGRYQAAYGESPHELAGLAYDGIAAVGALIAAGARPGRQPVLDRAPDPARPASPGSTGRSASARAAASSATSPSSRFGTARRSSPSERRGRLTPLASDPSRLAPAAPAWRGLTPAPEAILDVAGDRARRSTRPRAPRRDRSRDPPGGGRGAAPGLRRRPRRHRRRDRRARRARRTGRSTTTPGSSTGSSR